MRESPLWGFNHHYHVHDNSVTIGQVRRDQKHGIFSEHVIQSLFLKFFFSDSVASV